MNDLIKKLQDKTYVRAFGLMEKMGSRECFMEVGKENCLVFASESNGCGGRWRNATGLSFDDAETYAIKPDYQPEFVDLEIEILNEYLGVWGYKSKPRISLPHDFTHLHCLPSLPKFKCFFYLAKGKEHTLCIVDVAKRISEGKTVYARLWKRE